MTHFCEKVDSFRHKGQGLAKDLSGLKGMNPLHSGGFSAGSLSRSFLLLFLVPPEYTQSFRRLCFFAEHLFLRGNFRSLELFVFGPAAPSTYSRQGFGPSNYLFSGQQRLRHIRGRASVPRIISFRASSAFDIFAVGLRSLELSLFGPATPSTYSRQGSGPSNYLFRADSAFKIIEARL
jgi:hypothetical protein